MKRAGLLAIGLAVLLASTIWSQSLEVSVENVVAKTVVRTTSQTEFSVAGMVQVTPGAETVSDSKLQPVVLIRITSPVPRNRVKCRTARVEELEPNLFMISKPGEHVVEVDSVGLIDGELFWDWREVVVVVQSVDPDDGDEDEDIDDGDEDQDDEEDDPPQPDKPVAPADGYRVLVVYETRDVPNYPASTVAILSSQRLKEWLDSNTAIGSDGVTPDWRIVDQDSVFSDTGSPLAKLFERERQDVPWIVVINDGFVQYEGPLPSDIQSTIDLLESYK